MSPFTIYLTHHSHCDLGYTHDLPIVYELQRRYIDEVLDLADNHADLGEEATFRWTCEVTSVVEHWLETASPRQVERFVAAAQRGQIEGQLVEMFGPLRRFRDELGLRVRVAMNSDVNGFSWALAGLLASAGIEGLTMSINEHFGGAPQPFPGLFRWKTPQGTLLPVWNGPTYAHTAWLGIGGPADNAYRKLSSMATRFQEGCPDRNWLAMQVTHPGPQNDNMGPIPHLSPWVRRFNEMYGERVRLVITTPGRIFDAIRGDVAQSQVREGEWNDWWNFGCGSTPYETALFRRATARLEEADLLSLLKEPQNFRDLRTRAHLAAAHYIEHTWGADLSVHRPEDDDARIGSRHKERFAYDAYSLSRLLRRDGLSGLAARVHYAPAGPALMIFNPSPYPRHEVVRVPRRFLEALNLPPEAGEEPAHAPQRWPRDGAYQHFVDREAFGGWPMEEIGPFQLPPYGWTIATSARCAPRAENLFSTASTVTNGRVVLECAPGRPGLSRFAVAGREWAEGPLFGTVVAEEVLGDRGELMKFDDSLIPTTTRRPVWNENPPLRRSLPAEVSTSIFRGARFLDLIQTGKLPSTDGVSLRWRIFAEHDDVEVEIRLRQLPNARPHSYYFVLPFRLERAQRLVATAGLAVDPDAEAIPNGCRWWSAQEGFALGDESAAVYVATPDTPMIGFQQLPFGSGQVNDVTLAGPGVSWIWLANNYWETNFKADAAGELRVRFRLGFAPGKPAARELLRLGALARHDLAYHPLPESGGVAANLPPEGALWEVVSEQVVIEGCIAEPGAGSVRLILTNPGSEAAEISLLERSLRFVEAEQLDAEGRRLGPVSIAGGKLTLQVPPRASVFLRVEGTAR